MNTVHARPTRLRAVFAMLREGHPNREISRETGMHKDTVSKMRALLVRQGVPLENCPCGREATHNGWCAFRVEKSPDRRAYLSRVTSTASQPSALFKRLRLFEGCVVHADDTGDEAIFPANARSPDSVESGCIEAGALFIAKKLVNKASENESDVAIVLIDRLTDTAYLRKAYCGAANMLYVARSGRVLGGSGNVGAVSVPDLAIGIRGCPAHVLFAARLWDSRLRYIIYAVGELHNAGRRAVFGSMPASQLSTNKEICAASRRWWDGEYKTSERFNP